VSSKSSRPCFSFSTSFVRELTCFMLLFAASFDSEYFECNERRKSLGERKINACGREAWSWRDRFVSPPLLSSVSSPSLIFRYSCTRSDRILNTLTIEDASRTTSIDTSLRDLESLMAKASEMVRFSLCLFLRHSSLPPLLSSFKLRPTQHFFRFSIPTGQTSLLPLPPPPTILLAPLNSRRRISSSTRNPLHPPPTRSSSSSGNAGYGDLQGGRSLPEGVGEGVGRTADGGGRVDGRRWEREEEREGNDRVG